MADDDLATLFPDLAPILSNWGNYGGGGAGGIETDEHGGVTDEALQQYIDSRMSNGQRVGPSPLVSGQQPPATPQFQSGQGMTVPPPGGTEPAGDGQPSHVPPPAAPSPQGQPSPAAPPAPPAGDSPPPAGGQPPQPVIPDERIEAYRQFDEMLQSDPGLQESIVNYLRSKTGQPGQQPAVPATPQPQFQQPAPPFQPPQPQPTFPPTPVQPPQQPAIPQLPTPSAEDLAADPVLAAIWQTVQQQQGLISHLATNWQAQQEQIAARQQQEATALITNRVEAFQQARSLTPEQMQQVRDEASRSEALAAYVNSGMAPADAVDKVLDMAYWSIPEIRDAALAQHAQQQREDARRKQAAGALSGSSGSVPRTPSAVPTDPRERRNELIGVVSDMMNGTFVQPE